jgi:hypothetical protein
VRNRLERERAVEVLLADRHLAGAARRSEVCDARASAATISGNERS